MDFGMLIRHDRNNQWCKFPLLKCICGEASSRYERLDEESNLESAALRGDPDPSSSDSHYHRMVEVEGASGSHKEEKLVFYNDDGSYQTVVVEKNLCTIDLCQLLAMKNRTAKSVTWCIIEHWIERGMERIVEDHEYVLSVHKDVQAYSRNEVYRFVFRKDFRKYEFFHHPQQFFPADMIEMPRDNQKYAGMSIQDLILNEGVSPSLFGQVWVRDENKLIWGKAYLLLKDKKVYVSPKIQAFARYIRSKISVFNEDQENVKVLAVLAKYQIYSTLNAKNQFKAPTEWGICLRPTGVDANEDSENTGLLCLACESERARSCWLTGMRLAKYGKQLRENYRAFKNKQAEAINPRDYNSYTVPNVSELSQHESVRSRVAMDFTGAVGRIVDDPKEAKAIAVAEGYSWKRRWRPSTRISTSANMQGIESGVHITQPWFHSGMSRDQATSLVARYGTVDGVFLVRESRSNPGAFVLTYKYGKVLHAQIVPIYDALRDTHVFSLDSGQTRFYDLLQLVEFYQLNLGCLPTRLTHYVVQSTSLLSGSSSTAATPTNPSP